MGAGRHRLTLEAEAWRSSRSDREAEILIVVVRLAATHRRCGHGRRQRTSSAAGVDRARGGGIATRGAATRAEFVAQRRTGPGDSIDVVAQLSLPGGGVARLRAPRIAILRVD
jgi:hypothetical protein